MCGIAGYIKNKKSNYEINEKILSDMRDTLIHRGPDDFGNYISRDKKVGLAHRRLSIIDLSAAGHQPMCNEDGTVWITYNGEIYNYKDIKSDLIQKGHIFKSDSDTEVIIHAWEEYGENCLNLFNGMFAFAIYDEPQNKLFLARDRFGVKPLYYGFLNNNTFAFGSELKAIVKNPEFKKEIDYEALGCFFRYRYIPAPMSIWKSLKKLEHSHYVILNLNQFRLKKPVKYYNLKEIIKNRPVSTVEEVDFLLKEAVKKRLLTSDVEVGTFLSGGIDSSAITMIASKLHQNIKAFTTGFDDEAYDEVKYAEEIARYLGVTHYVNKVPNTISENYINKMADVYDEPMADTSNVPTCFLSELTSKYVKVALTGDGGDEVFSGYNWYGNYKKVLGENPVENFILTNFKKNEIDNRYQDILFEVIHSKFYKKAFSVEMLEKMKFSENLFYTKYFSNQFKDIRVLQYIDLNMFMIEDCLVKMDRASMAHSLEVRIPMLDYKLVEAVYSLPEEVFSSSVGGKPVLKSLMKNDLLASTINRKKKGFSAPCHNWDFFQRDKILKALDKGFLVENNIIKDTFIKEDMISGHYFMLYMLELWSKKWM